MKAERITMKSTSCRECEKFKDGTMFRVVFSDIPDYVKDTWLAHADGICNDEENQNPKLEMEAVLMQNGDLHNIEIEYYFDGYVAIELEQVDKGIMCDLFKEICIKNGDMYPDAYKPETGSSLGDCEWAEHVSNMKITVRN